jgi:hypothetical protein
MVDNRYTEYQDIPIIPKSPSRKPLKDNSKDIYKDLIERES